MAPNPARRALLLDAAIECLGRHGARALTFRRVDEQAGQPRGTASNYFPTRADLAVEVAGRVFERLTPDPARLTRIAANHAGGDAVEEYAAYVVERLLADPACSLALIELRLEATRDPAVAGVVGPFLRDGLASDQAFHRGQGLPGGDAIVVLEHQALLGLVLDALTVPLAPEQDPIRAARILVRHLLDVDVRTPGHGRAHTIGPG